jgi:hypothetical protein
MFTSRIHDGDVECWGWIWMDIYGSAWFAILYKVVVYRRERAGWLEEHKSRRAVYTQSSEFRFLYPLLMNLNTHHDPRLNLTDCVSHLRSVAEGKKKLRSGNRKHGDQSWESRSPTNINRLSSQAV